MLECSIFYKANWYFGSDYMARKLFRLYSGSCKLQVLHRKGVSMLIGLKVSSLTCKCVFYRPEVNAKVRPHGIEFCKPWNKTYQWIELKEYTRKLG